MKTRIHKWLSLKAMGVRYGVQVKHDGKWMHAHRDGNPMIFKTKARAEQEQRKIEGSLPDE